MNRSTVIFFFSLLAVVAIIARCNSRSHFAEQQDRSILPGSPLLPSAAPSPVASTTAFASPAAQGNKPVADLTKSASQVQPAAVSVSVFEPAGKLLRRGSGILISRDGKILTSRSLMEGAAYAIAKTGDNQIYNVSGILTDSAADDLAVLKTEVKDAVQFVEPRWDTSIENGEHVAVVQCPLGQRKISIVEGTIEASRNDSKTQWFRLSIPVANDWMGAPVVNARGQMIGLVTRGPGNPAVVVRPANTLSAVIARTPLEGKGKWLAQEAVPAPAEGPLNKVPLAQNAPGRRSKLIYSPAPSYPSAARNSSGMVKGSGRFRLTFDSRGQVKNINVLRSTQNGALDQAAIQALRQWKAAPGEEWTLNVPITFQ